MPRHRGCLWFAIAFVGAAFLSLAACFLVSGARNDVLMRVVLNVDYPRFRVTKLSYTYDWAWASLDGGVTAVYFFELESQDVPGFRLVGNYYLVRAGGPQGWGARRTMFDRRRMPASQLVDLERLWVRRFPSFAVEVGDDSSTGLLQPEDLGSRIAAKYRGVPANEVYFLIGYRDSDRSRQVASFRLKADSGTWQYLPGFVTSD